MAEKARTRSEEADAVTSEWHQRVREVFLLACDLSPEERPALLDRVCGEDGRLRREVASLLRFHDATNSRAAAAVAGLQDPAGEASTPEWVGPYRLLQRLGEGGMGVVYEAEQEKPVRRRVAVKLVKWGMDTKEVVARFESERQALALMSHPNVARVLDAGATEQGRPYFAMEFVKGVPITDYCDRHQLGAGERIALFIDVCEGVQHAHQRGIIHRDVKPSNVLVVMEGGHPVPKIIDFGVAKATAQKLTEHTVFTRLGQWIGTPEYMSPEQAEMNALDVDTRTDVYSLGVMLYELLVGAMPFDPAELRRAGFDEMRRVIREKEPPRPSTRASTLGDASEVAAKQRRTDPHGLVRALRGDLDWITMRALEKDRTRRYGSPSDLAADLRRHLGNEPVLAGPPSTSYRLGKLVRRHRLGVTAAVLVLAALVLGSAGATLGLLRAEREAAAARRVSDLLIGVFAIVDPGSPSGHATSAEAILDRGAASVGEALPDQPVMQARLLATIGNVYVNLGRYADARPLLEKALALQRSHLGEAHPDVAGTLHALGWLHAWLGEYPAARRDFEGATRIAAAARGPDDARTLLYRSGIAWVLWRTGDYAGASRHAERSLELAESSPAPDELTVAELLYRDALFRQELGDYARSRAAYERSLAIRERILGPEHIAVGWTLHDLGLMHERAGRYEEARGLYGRALAVQQRALGPDHMAVAYPLTGLGRLALREDDLAAAGSYLERALEIRERALGADHPDVAWTLVPLARLRDRAGDHAAARRLLERTLRIDERAFGSDHPDSFLTLVRLATWARRHGSPEEARTLYRRAEATLESSSASGRNRARNLYNLACVTALRGEKALALERLREAVRQGFARGVILADPDLASLRGDPEFEAIVAEVRRRLGASRGTS